MRALTYLLFTQAKNRILNLRKKPAMLVLYCFIFFVIIISVLYLLQASNDIKTGYADNRIIYLIIGAVSD